MNRTLAEYRAVRAVELAMDGKNYDEIAVELGYANRSGAWKAVRRCLAHRSTAAADTYIALTLLDLELVQDRVWGAAISGNLRAAEVALRAMEDRWRFAEMLPEQETERKRKAPTRPSKPRPRGSWPKGDRQVGAFWDFLA